MRADTRLPPYLPYPRFLLQADLAQTAKLLYALLLDRATLSQANGWLDEGGRIYLVFPIEKIAAALDRSPMTVKTALSELEDAGLTERRRSGFSKPNRIYVKLPSDGQKSFRVTDRNPSSIEKENCLTDGQKVVPMMERKLSPNNLSSSNLNQNHMSRERTAPAAPSSAGRMTRRVGNTTYRVTLHFKENGKEDMNDPHFSHQYRLHQSAGHQCQLLRRGKSADLEVRLHGKLRRSFAGRSGGATAIKSRIL